MAEIYNSQINYGICDDFLTLPIENLPPNAVRVRRKMRADDYWKVFIKTSDGTVFGCAATRNGEALRLEAFPSLGVNLTARI